MRLTSTICNSTWLAAICVPGWLLSAEPAPMLHRTDSILPAQLVELDSSLNWQFSTDAGPLTVPRDQLVRWGGYPGATRQPAVWLRDGSWLCGELSVIDRDTVRVTSDWFASVKLPMREIRGLLFAPPASLMAWQRTRTQMQSHTGQRDAVWLRGDRQATGVVRWPAAPLLGEGLDQLELDNGISTTTLQLSDVQQIVFSPALLGKPPDSTDVGVGQTIGMTDGSWLPVRELKPLEKQRLSIQLDVGVTLETLDDRAEFCRGVKFLSNSPANATFLATLKPASYRQLSSGQLDWPLGENRDLCDRPLVGKSGEVLRGLAMHSASQVAYRWDGSPAKFLAEVCFAPPAPGAEPDLGSVQCSVLVAQQGKLQTAKQFSLRRTDGAQAVLIEVDLTGAQLVAMLVDQADFGNYGDHLLWLDARITK